MSLLKKNKEKLVTLDVYLRSNSAMKSVAAMLIGKFKKKLKILELMDYYNFSDEYSKQDFYQKKFLHIFVGCNQGMCGTFLSKIIFYAKNKIQSFSENDYAYILGEKFTDYSKRSNVQTCKVCCDLDLVRMNNQIYEFIVDHYITDVLIHYSMPSEIKSNVIFESRNIESSYSVHEMLFLLRKISFGVYSSGLYENKERVLALEQANTNALKIKKKTLNDLNRIRQDSITNDLAEIVSGVLL